MNQAQSTTILNAQLDFNDPDNIDSVITYTVTSLTANGTLFRNAVPLGIGGTLTQADIVGNLPTYTYNGSETTSDSFGFSVTDGVTPAITGTFAIAVTPQNDLLETERQYRNDGEPGCQHHDPECAARLQPSDNSNGRLSTRSPR